MRKGEDQGPGKAPPLSRSCVAKKGKYDRKGGKRLTEKRHQKERQVSKEKGKGKKDLCPFQRHVLIF